MNWSRRYLGLPWLDKGRTRDGCDCWGVACLIYAGELGIVLPSYAEGMCGAERAEIAGVFEAARSAPWNSVADTLPDAMRLARPFDIAVFRRGKLDAHVGVVIKPGLMIHASDGTETVVERFDGGAWAHRFAGLYRHDTLPF